jgi:hypothetical protein
VPQSETAAQSTQVSKPGSIATSSASELRAATTTAAPRRTASRAVARPIPLEAPVMTRT